MKIFSLTENSKLYTSNVYLLLGTWNAVSDMNTLIDTGCDDGIIEKIQSINTGLGKKKIDLVLLTHSHSDHSALTALVKEKFGALVYALNPYLAGVDRIINDGDFIKVADTQCEVFRITAHSNDSACFYFEREGILFAGDTKFPINFDNPVLARENEQVLWRLKKKKIEQVYYGHGPMHDFRNKTFRVV